jgi:arylsulfatase A-like enzyme
MDWPLLEPAPEAWETFHDPHMDWSKPIQNGPTCLGFDTFFGISASLDMPPYAYIEGDRLTETPTVKKNFFRNRTGPAVESFEAENVLQDLGRRACQDIQRLANDKRPFFLYLSLNSPHTPIAPSAGFRGKSGISAYADFVMETDAVVGDVLNQLEEVGVRENTLVIFTSDNGCSPEAGFEELAAHGHFPSHHFRGAKADLFDGGHRVPFLVSWPAKVKAGSECAAPVCLTDFFATAAEILAHPIPENAGEDSTSFLPELLGQPGRPAEYPLVHQSINGSLSIREGRWKLLLSPGSGGWSSPHDKEAILQGLPLEQLYDLETDISEKHNLANAHPEIVQRMTRSLEALIARGRTTEGPDQNNDVPVPLRPNLR